MNGKVETVRATGNEWTTPNAPGKTFYDFEYQITGTAFVASHVTPEAKYSIGDEVWFKVTKDNGTYPDKIKFEQAPEEAQQAGKPSFKKSGSFDNFDTMIMSYAKDLAVARIHNGYADKIKASDVIKDFLILKEGLAESIEGITKYEDGKATPLPTEAPPVEVKTDDNIPDWIHLGKITSRKIKIHIE